MIRRNAVKNTDNPPGQIVTSRSETVKLVEMPRVLPETMSRDEMLEYYSSYANLCAHEALQYQKKIRTLTGRIIELGAVLEECSGNINPERGFADELEADITKVLHTTKEQ